MENVDVSFERMFSPLGLSPGHLEQQPLLHLLDHVLGHQEAGVETDLAAGVEELADQPYLSHL